MKIEVTYLKESDLTVRLFCEDPQGFHTCKVFEGEDGEPSRFLEGHFPLTPKGVAEAQNWVGEVIANLRKEVEEWRGFVLPPAEVYII